MEIIATRIGKRGTIVIPTELRRKYKLEEGSAVVAESRDEGILIRPAVTLPVEIYTPERKAEFLLNNAVSPDETAWAEKEIRHMGLDPDRISRGRS